MIKSFEQFINENYNETKSISLNEEYGAPLFNEISESLLSEITDSINEGKLVVDANMIEEGIFSAIGKLFKKGSDEVKDKIEDNQEDISDMKGMLKSIIDMPNTGNDIVSLAKDIKYSEIESSVLEKIEELCKMAEDICTELSEKEENTYKTISEKLTATNDAIKEFTKKAIEKINEIITISKNKVADVIAAVAKFCQKMAEISKDALVKIGKGIVIAFVLPFILAFAVYKGAKNVCKMLVEKTKEGAKIVKETFVKIKNTINNWVVEMLNNAKESLKKSCDEIEEGAKKAHQSIGKAYLAIVAILGQLASDVKNEISKSYNDFVESVEELSEETKAFISEKWNIVSNWCKKTSTSFAEGVKTVWGKVKEKVVDAIGSAKDAYKTLEDNAESTWNDIKGWADEKQKDFLKANVKYAIDKWGKDEVSSWLDKN